MAFAIPCSRCGEIHTQEIGYGLPDAALRIPADEADARLVGDKDHHVIDGRLFFIRAWAPVPLHFELPGGVTSFGIGFWIQVNEAAHRDYLACEAALLAGQPRPHATYEGRIANQFDLLGHCLGTAVRATYRPPIDGWGQNPELHALDLGSWLGRLQRSGLSAQRHAAWMERCAHPGEPEPAGSPFAADLDEHGWEIVSAEQLDRPPHVFAKPPAPGDYIKLAVRFLSANEEGDVHPRNAGWWICVDDASNATLWTGTLFSVPLPGSPIANGARIWFPPAMVLGHQLPETSQG